MTTKIKTIILINELIEIHFNVYLKNKPYLIRLYTYEDVYPLEIRLDQNEIQALYKILNRYNLCTETV